MSQTYNQDIGERGENAAANYLKENQYDVIDRNWKYKNHLEIDLIAWSKKKDLVAVEVKTHENIQMTEPYEAVDSGKIARLKNALEKYVDEKLDFVPPMQVDVISIVLNPLTVEHFESVDFDF